MICLGPVITSGVSKISLEIDVNIPITIRLSKIAFTSRLSWRQKTRFTKCVYISPEHTNYLGSAFLVSPWPYVWGLIKKLNYKGKIILTPFLNPVKRALVKNFGV